MVLLRRTVVCTVYLFIFNLYGQNLSKNFEHKTFNELRDLYYAEEDTIIKNQISDAFINKAKRTNNQSKLARGYYYKVFLQEKKEDKIRYYDSIINNTNPPLKNEFFPVIAYLEKGYLYEVDLRFMDATDCYLKAKQEARIRGNDFFQYKATFSIALLESERLGEVEDALKLYKECYDFIITKKDESELYTQFYEYVLFSLADSYKSLGDLEMASYYNRLGYKQTLITQNMYLNGCFILNEGANLTLKGNYKASLDSIKIALPKIKKSGDKFNEMAAYYYYGKAYSGLNNQKQAVKYFIKQDSVAISLDQSYPELMSAYPYLINYYRSIENKELQLKYTNRYIELDSFLQVSYKKLSKKIRKDYEIPTIIEDRDELISTLKRKNENIQYNFIWVSVIALLIFVLACYQYILRKRLRRKFNLLIEKDVNTNDVEIETSITKDTDEIELGISQEIVELILEELKVFEQNKKYLKSNLTLQKVAQQLNTNSNYLSKIINRFKNKNFTQYINDLRIDYIVKELQVNSQLRKYTISAIATEVGFNNSESFSKAFYKKTGLKPSYFVKNLNDINSGR